MIAKWIIHIITRNRIKVNKLLKRLGRKTRNKNILEIGSGKSDYYSAKRFFDNSNNFKKSDKNGEFKHELVDITKVNFNESYDMIICVNVLEHIYDFMYPLHDEPEDYFRYTEYAIIKLLNQFNQIKIKHHGLKRFPFAYYIEAIK